MSEPTAYMLVDHRGIDFAVHLEKRELEKEAKMCLLEDGWKIVPLYRDPEPDDREGLVEAAFREGFAAGYESGMDDAHYDSPAGEGVENAWAESDAHRALRDRLQAQEAGDE